MRGGQPLLTLAIEPCPRHSRPIETRTATWSTTTKQGARHHSRRLAKNRQLVRQAFVEASTHIWCGPGILLPRFSRDPGKPDASAWSFSRPVATAECDIKHSNDSGLMMGLHGVHRHPKCAATGPRSQGWAVIRDSQYSPNDCGQRRWTPPGVEELPSPSVAIAPVGVTSTANHGMRTTLRTGTAPAGRCFSRNRAGEREDSSRVPIRPRERTMINVSPLVLMEI